LLLPRYTDLTETEELDGVVLIGEPWTCERHRDADGTTTDVYHPSSHGPTIGWDAATDESWSERVVILSPQSGDIEARLRADDEALSDAASLADYLHKQALETRRHMVAEGQLLSADEICARLGISRKRFGRTLADGELFGLDVDGTDYFPALLADRQLDRKRLRAICDIIVPAPTESRVDFLMSRRGSLVDRSPLEILRDDADYWLLRKVAKAWAAEYSRTAVRLYEGQHETEPDGVEPRYTAIAEIDPRRPLWERASKALHEHGYEWPLGPYPETRNFSMFVEQQAAGYSEPRAEACVQITANGGLLRVRIIHKGSATRQSQTVAAGKRRSVVEVAERVIAYLRKR
jgi:hypothetical protein